MHTFAEVGLGVPLLGLGARSSTPSDTGRVRATIERYCARAAARRPIRIEKTLELPSPPRWSTRRPALEERNVDLVAAG
jgi:hypothetical protein